MGSRPHPAGLTTGDPVAEVEGPAAPWRHGRVSDEKKAGKRSPVVKVTTISYDSGSRSHVAPNERTERRLFGDIKHVLPPYSPESLCTRFENSNCLRQNIDAYATTIDGYGHRLVPVVNLQAEDADQRVADLIVLERSLAADLDGDGEIDEIPEPTKQEIADKKAQLQRAMRLELARTESWFEHCSPRVSFVGIRMRMRQDKELTGNGYWEGVRNSQADLVELVHVRPSQLRIRPIGEPIAVWTRIATTPISYTQILRPMAFRSYVQITDGAKKIYFKEFGDPRVMSAETGDYFPDPTLKAEDPPPKEREAQLASRQRAIAAMRGKEPNARPATELLHFLVYAPRSGPYGVPRWIGNLLSVDGSRHAEETNLNGFENNMIPSQWVLVGGGSIDGSDVEKIKGDLKEFREKKNRNGVIVLQAQAPDNAAGDATSGAVKIDVKPMTGDQISDALFMNYDEKNRDKVGESFRTPRIVRGDTRDFNRATAEAALTIFEDQVCRPERNEFDHFMNAVLLPDIGVKYHRFVSNAPNLADPAVRAEILEKLSGGAPLTAQEAREEAAKIIGRELKQIEGDWLDLPLPFTLAGMSDPLSAAGAAAAGDEDEDEEDGAPADGDKTPTEGDDAAPPAKKKKGRRTKLRSKALVGQAARLLLLREVLKTQERDVLLRAFKDAKRAKNKRPAPKTTTPEYGKDNDEELT